MATADQYYQQILDAKKNYNRDPKKYTAQSNSARDALKQMGIDTSSGAWASGNDYRTADQQYLTDKYQKQVQDMYSNMQQSQLGQLHASQQAATNKLNQQKAEYGQQVHGQKGQEDVRYVQAAERLKEVMAKNGILSSGENVTANVGLNAQRDNSLNALDQQYNNYSRDIADQISSVNDPSKEQSIVSQLAAQQAQALLNAQQTAYNQAGQEAQANQSQLNWDKQFNQQNNQFDQGMGWNYWQAQNANTQAQAQAAAQIKAYQDMIAALGGGGNFNTASGGGGTTAPANVQGIVNSAASKYKLNPQLLSAVIKTESNFNPNAKSSAGAIGLMQLMPGTAQGLGVDPYNPQQNVLGGSKYLSNMIHKYGDVKLALAAYNAGPGNVDFALQKAHSSDWNAVKRYLPKETQNYVPKVLSNI